MRAMGVQDLIGIVMWKIFRLGEEDLRKLGKRVSFLEAQIRRANGLPVHDGNTPTGASTNPKNFDLNKNLNLNMI